IKNMEEMDITLPDLTETSVDEREVFSIQANSHQLIEKKLEDDDRFSGVLNEEDIYYVSFPSSPIQLSGNPSEGFKKEDYELINDYIATDEVMFSEEYHNLQYDEIGKRFVLYQYVEGLPIIDGSSEISLFVNQEGQVYAFQQSYAGPVSKQGKALNLIDGKRAIELLFINNEIREGFKIEEPVLAYYRTLDLEDLTMYSPVWSVDVIRSSEKENFRVDAVTGTIIKRQSMDKPENSLEENEDGTEENEKNEKN
ncbi:MAG: two-component system regulatory protein YycI, partial [Atopostipes suicloacalis]|nr:two-component system regulatory protein YycI [Atopostipes suicloacalis]